MPSDRLANWLEPSILVAFVSWLVIAPTATPFYAPGALCSSPSSTRPLVWTHTCTSSCQLAHCNRRLTRINYSSLTCDIHTCRTLTLTHAHWHTRTLSSVHSSPLKPTSHMDSNEFQLPTSVSLIDISFYCSATLSYAPLSIYLSACLSLSLEIEPCPCPELVKLLDPAAAAAAAALSLSISALSASFVIFIFTRIYCYLFSCEKTKVVSHLFNWLFQLPVPLPSLPLSRALFYMG